MKMKKGLMSVVFLLATSSAMAAMSFSSAEVKSDMSFSVKNSNEALLALIANADHAAPGYNSYGELAIDLNKGYQGSYGVQNDSKYTWNKLFTVKNNSEKEITVKVKANKKTGFGTHEVSGGSEVSVLNNDIADRGHDNNPPVASTPGILTITNGNDSNQLEFKLAPGATKDINLILDTNNVQATSFKDFNLNVSAVRTDGK